MKLSARADSGRRRVSWRPRSPVTGGRALFIDGDPRSAWSRRFHDLMVAHVSDLGGADVLSEAQFSLIRRAAAIECELERLDAGSRLASRSTWTRLSYAAWQKMLEQLGLVDVMIGPLVDTFRGAGREKGARLFEVYARKPR